MQPVFSGEIPGHARSNSPVRCLVDVVAYKKNNYHQLSESLNYFFDSLFTTQGQGNPVHLLMTTGHITI
jgi:hypothetical protein